MAPQDVTRKLAAIIAADVAGYSRLMGADEAGTLAALKAHRQELIGPELATRGGRVVGTAGDSILAEFASVVDAVDCAVAIQAGMAGRNADLPDDRKMLFRMGVNLGDVIVDGDDIYGDGVNVAARLEELAEPGGICVSAKVRNEVAGKVEAGFDDLGEQQFKNITDSVRAYRVTRDQLGVSEPLPLPDKPSIAVLPFTNMSGDPEQEYFSDGITEDIITELARFRSLFVIARNSSFTFKDQAVNVGEVGDKLGVRYVVEGSVRKAGNRVRVTAQLVEAASGNHIWAERYDRELEDIFAVQDELVRTITSTVGGRVDAAGQSRVERMSEDDLRSYDHVLRASAAYFRMTKDDSRRAHKHLEKAIQLDPQSSQAHNLLAMVQFVEWMAYWVEDRKVALLSAFENAKRAVALDETFSVALATLGEVQVFRREFDDAQHSLDRAIELNPNDAHSQGVLSVYLIAVSRADKALAQLDLSTRINPLQPDWFNWIRGIAFFTARRYDEAIAALRAVRNPINEARGWLAASYAGAGRFDEARATLEDFLCIAEDDMAVFPGCKMAAWEEYWHGAMQYQNDADFEHLYDALRKAGMED